MPNEIDWDALRDECVAHLQALLRLDTTNPPGNETLAADYLTAQLTAAGIESDAIESTPGRSNVVARLRSDGSGGSALMLTGHVDVVSVERDKWTRNPFGGELVDGYVWGRGALDMKGQVAAELTVLLWLKRQGLTLTRDVLFVAFADEEAGGKDGAAWLWKNRPELLDAEFAFNEGGGAAIELNGQRFYLLQAGEKGASRLRIVARGNPGHASVPLDDTAMARLGRALVRLHEWQPPTTLTAPVRQFLTTVAPALGPDYEARVAAILAQPTWEAIAALPIDHDTRLMLRATTRNTAVPTIVHGGHRINVIPSEIVLDVDGRILPEQDPDDWREQVQAVVGDEVEVQLLSREQGIAFDPSGALFDSIAKTIDDLDPGAKVVPFLVSGGTDARHIPGVKVLGFFPFPVSDRTALYSTLIHGHDERIAVEDLAFATKFLYQATARFCARA